MKKSEMVHKASLYWLGLFEHEASEHTDLLDEVKLKMIYLIEYLVHNGMLPPKVWVEYGTERTYKVRPDDAMECVDGEYCEVWEQE